MALDAARGGRVVWAKDVSPSEDEDRIPSYAPFDCREIDPLPPIAARDGVAPDNDGVAPDNDGDARSRDLEEADDDRAAAVVRESRKRQTRLSPGERWVGSRARLHPRRRGGATCSFRLRQDRGAGGGLGDGCAPARGVARAGPRRAVREA